MQILGAELEKKFQAHDGADLIIVDMAAKDVAFSRTIKASDEFPDAKIVFFKNDDTWVIPRGIKGKVDLIIEDGFNNVIIDVQ
jgi:hypothetical protein